MLLLLLFLVVGGLYELLFLLIVFFGVVRLFCLFRVLFELNVLLGFANFRVVEVVVPLFLLREDTCLFPIAVGFVMLSALFNPELADDVPFMTFELRERFFFNEFVSTYPAVERPRLKPLMLPPVGLFLYRFEL